MSRLRMAADPIFPLSTSFLGWPPSRFDSSRYQREELLGHAKHLSKRSAMYFRHVRLSWAQVLKAACRAKGVEITVRSKSVPKFRQIGRIGLREQFIYSKLRVIFLLRVHNTLGVTVLFSALSKRSVDFKLTISSNLITEDPVVHFSSRTSTIYRHFHVDLVPWLLCWLFLSAR